ncbi:MAG: outer membrane protein assembly factor BamA, partial [Candidatus Omnitrophota bacterium]|nr:outer membrane protein assembly factor BamA [Candidatus Omnitrophota bacterium]
MLSALLAGFCLISVLVLPAFAEDEAQVTSVEVEGNKIVSTATILTKIKTRPGDRMSQQTVDEDIKRLYSTGFFSDVSADIRPLQGGQMVRFIVQERPLVSGVVITGHRNFREAKLREEIKTKEQELLDRRELKQDVDRLKQLYRTKGFHLAEVATDVKVDEATNKATVFFTISEGGKLKVRRIQFEGNEHISTRRLRRAMATKQAWSFITPGYYRPEVLKEDEERVKVLYRSQGYSDAQAVAESNLDEKKHWMTIFVKVTEGPLYTVGEITFQGVRQIPMDLVQEELALKTGEPFSQDKMYEDVGKIQAAYFSKGYMAASVDPATALNPLTQKVDLTYTVTEGSIAIVGRIIVKGNVKTKDKVIRRELRLNPGDRYDGEKLRRSKERLYNLGYFEEVTMETVPSEDQPDQRDLVVNVKESKSGEFSLGGGFISVDRLNSFSEITQRNFYLFNWTTFVCGCQELKFQ